MSRVKVNDKFLDVDVEAELKIYEWKCAEWKGNKLIACSPFRNESRPSFFVTLTGEYAGAWCDSGAVDEHYSSGGLVKLLAFLREEPYEDTVEYLHEMYGNNTNPDKFKLNVDLRIPTPRKPLPLSHLDQYNVPHSYLLKRGILPKTVKAFKIGYDKKRNAVTIPWLTLSNEVGNIKYRSVYSKVFWYEKGALPIRNLVYGMHMIHKFQFNTVVICEAEIDSLTWWSNGFPSIATGGKHLTKEQVSTLNRSPITTLIINRDNDQAGRAFSRRIVSAFSATKRLEYIPIRSCFKDANEAHIKNSLRCVRYPIIPKLF